VCELRLHLKLPGFEPIANTCWLLCLWDVMPLFAFMHNVGTFTKERQDWIRVLMSNITIRSIYIKRVTLRSYVIDVTSSPIILPTHSSKSLLWSLLWKQKELWIRPVPIPIKDLLSSSTLIAWLQNISLSQMTKPNHTY
jgi:hypothetical protein